MREGSPIATITERAGGGATLSLRGSVTILSAEALLHAAQEAVDLGDVTVDLSAVDRVDVSGLQVLLSLRKTLREADREFKLQGVPDAVQQLLTVSGLALPLGYDAAGTAGPKEDTA